MIEVKNTKELEKRYKLDKIPDDEMIVVWGGLSGKAKYKEPKYKERVTYTAKEIKQIISKMKEIEDTIPKEWSDWQKAKYIYEVLIKNITSKFDEKRYNKLGQFSNLSVILSRKALYDGYSLLFKEMMDRQSIPCDYIRGKYIDYQGKEEKHAWNVLKLDEDIIPVDLTMEAKNVDKGYNVLEYFGDSKNFEAFHRPDPDEERYIYSHFTPEFINQIDTKVPRTEIERKKQILKDSLQKTYRRFLRSFGSDGAKKQIKTAILEYITEGTGTLFTKENGVRNRILQNITRKDMLYIIAEDYVTDTQKKLQGKSVTSNPLEHAIKENCAKYGKEATVEALEDYILNNNTNAFTKQNNARVKLINLMNPAKTLDMVIESAVDRELQTIKSNKDDSGDKVMSQKTKIYFEKSELANVKLPKEKQSSMLKKAMSWINKRQREKRLKAYKNAQTHVQNKGHNDSHQK